MTEIGTVILAVEWEYDDNSNLTGLTSGPCWLDENTLGKWGQEGDFKYVDSSEYADSSPDSTEISAYYIYHWYGEEPYEITDKDTIDKITAWIENAKSVCKDYPYIDGLEYGGADAYGISLERMNQVMRMRAFVLLMFHSIRGTPQAVCTLKVKYAILA